MFNKSILVGNLTKDIELRYSQNGTAMGKSSIAVNRKFTVSGGLKRSDGSEQSEAKKREEVMFIDVVFFGRLAEIANQYTFKGSKVLIEGRLVQETWKDASGQNRSKHVISVENMEMLGGDNGYSAKSNQSNTQNNTNNNTYLKTEYASANDDKVAEARDFANSISKKDKENRDMDRNLELLNEEYDRINETIPF